MPGPKEASLNINPYLSPLVLELQQAWNEGFTGWPASYGLFWENWVLHSGTLHRQNAFVVAPFKFISICKQFLVLYVATLQNIIVHWSGQDHRPLLSYDLSAGAHDSPSFGRYYPRFPPDVALPVMVDPLKMLGKKHCIARYKQEKKNFVERKALSKEWTARASSKGSGESELAQENLLFKRWELAV